MSNYPDGFGSARDLDHVDGPLSEEDINENCPKCYNPNSLYRVTWRLGSPQILCYECDYEREATDDEAWCCDAGPIGHPGRHWKEE